MVAPSARVMYTMFPPWIYMPCKNSASEALKKWQLQLPLQCAASAEMELYESECLSCDVSSLFTMLSSLCVYAPNSPLPKPASCRYCYS